MSSITAYLDRSDAPARLGDDTAWGLFGLWVDTLPEVGNEVILHLWEQGWEDDLPRLEDQVQLALAEHPPQEDEVYEVTSNLLDALEGRDETDAAIAVGVGGDEDFAETEEFCGGPGSGKPGPCPANKPHVAKAAAARSAATAAGKDVAKAEKAAKRKPTEDNQVALNQAKQKHADLHATAAKHEEAAKRIEEGNKPKAAVKVPAAPMPQKSPAKPAAQPAVAQPARSFQGAADAHAWGNQAYGDWAGSLSKDEYKSVGRYMNHEYRDINNGLRTSGGKPTGELKAKAKLMDAALAKAKTPEALTVHRGLGADVVAQMKPGATFQDHGYVSTSLNPGVGEHYGQATMEIRVPKGSQGAYATAIMKSASPGTEQEFLLPRGSKFRVVSVGEKNGKPHVVAELS